MIKKQFLLYSVCFTLTAAANDHQKLAKAPRFKADVNVVGYLKFANGLGRVTTTWIDILSKQFKVKFIDTRPQFSSLEDIPFAVKSIARNKNHITNNSISILTDNIWIPHFTPSRSVPTSTIRIAYSMCESTRIPPPWVAILNKQFDAVLVPDPYFLKVYEDSGVKIPVFSLPLALYLDDFLKAPLKESAHSPFVFGVSAALSRNKNISLLIDAFAAEFGGNPHVVLKIHTPSEGNLSEIRDRIRLLNLHNVELFTGPLAWQKYVQFMRQIDCYVLLSKGEGFSITPREALALGIPCILSNNTAHETICKTGLVYAVPCPIRQPSEREFYHVDVGVNFSCLLKDVRKALRHVYTNYQTYLQQAQQRRDWARQYTFDNLKGLYYTIIKPKSVLLGPRNEITSSYLMTTSLSLNKKYHTVTGVPFIKRKKVRINGSLINP